ncbi:MAG TPA: DUF4912 domain-containing protein [Polyangiaceae bacterium]
MNRAELEKLDRDALVVLAEGAGVTRARIRTRPELVDELLLRSSADEASKRRARGFFGVARDLVARVVERGLHLPDAAERIRTLGIAPPPKRSAPAALPTVTLAEIYAAQGHRERAVETLESVLARESDHAAAKALLMQLKDSAYPVPEPPLPPEEEEEPTANATSSAAAQEEPEAEEPPREPFGMLDDTPLPTRYDVDECVAIPVDPTTLYVYWEARESTLATVRRSAPGGSLFLRIVVIVPTWDGPRSRTQDIAIDASLGDWFVRDLPPGCVVRAALGWKHGEAFDSLSHSPSLETPPGSPSPLVADVLVRWTPTGASRVQPGDPDAAAIERALGRVRREAAHARQSGMAGGSALGSSERWANAPWS